MTACPLCHSGWCPWCGGKQVPLAFTVEFNLLGLRIGSDTAIAMPWKQWQDAVDALCARHGLMPTSKVFTW